MRADGGRTTAVMAVGILVLSAVGFLAARQLGGSEPVTQVATENEPGPDSPAGGSGFDASRRCQPAQTANAPDRTTVLVYFFCGDASPPEEPVALPRSVPKTGSVLRVAVEALLRGSRIMLARFSLAADLAGSLPELNAGANMTSGPPGGAVLVQIPMPDGV